MKAVCKAHAHAIQWQKTQMPMVDLEREMTEKGIDTRASQRLISLSSLARRASLISRTRRSSSSALFWPVPNLRMGGRAGHSAS